MASKHPSIIPRLQTFIENQKMFFVGTGGTDGTVNVSPKGMDSFRVLSPNRIMWLNLTGSGNETAAHLLEQNRITIMFCAFEGDPMILRLYGSVTTYHPSDPEWEEWIGLFPDYVGSRQIFDVQVDLVQTSCGYAVPLYDFQGQRDRLKVWAEKKGSEGIKEYWQEKNTLSIDGKATGMSNS